MAQRRKTSKKEKAGGCGCDLLEGCSGCSLLMLTLTTALTLLASAAAPVQSARIVRAELSRSHAGPDSLLIALMRLYQHRVSPRLPARCQFPLTCSEYGVRAVREHGVRRGLGLTRTRIRECGRTARLARDC